MLEYERQKIKERKRKELIESTIRFWRIVAIITICIGGLSSLACYFIFPESVPVVLLSVFAFAVGFAANDLINE